MLENDQRSYTIEEAEALEGEYELDEGILVPVTRPKRIHARVCAKLIVRLGNHCEATGQGEVLDDCGFVLERGPDTLRGPDVAVILAERARELPRNCHPEGAPDLVVEVASESNRPGQLLRKVGQYLDAGAALVWVLHPDRGTVVVYHADGQTEILRQEQELTG
ncbi:MAG: Uma2 family endonuclease, partial [Chloroflexi bacterium]|nr:Uma2 family endonuclease [Chloroflexota bacterium]